MKQIGNYLVDVIELSNHVKFGDAYAKVKDMHKPNDFDWTMASRREFFELFEQNDEEMKSLIGEDKPFFVVSDNNCFRGFVINFKDGIPHTFTDKGMAKRILVIKYNYIGICERIDKYKSKISARIEELFCQHGVRSLDIYEYSKNNVDIPDYIVNADNIIVTVGLDDRDRIVIDDMLGYFTKRRIDTLMLDKQLVILSMIEDIFDRVDMKKLPLYGN